jgi:hypothetical protein
VVKLQLRTLIKDRIIHAKSLKNVKALLTGKGKLEPESTARGTSYDHKFAPISAKKAALKPIKLKGSTGECLYNHPIRQGITYTNAKGLTLAGNIE